MKDRTRVTHPPDVVPPADNRPLVAPLYQSVKFEVESTAETERVLRGERPGFLYSRSSNPTVRQLELLLAELQGRDDCIAVGSGVAALAVPLLALLKSGDHVLCFIESYTPTRHLIRRLLGRYGVTHTLLSITDTAGIEQTLASRPTRLVMFESPTNPTTRIADIEWLVETTHRHGALAVLDNTFAGFHNHGQYAVDVFVHSLTKFASGHGDVMGGAVIAPTALVREMRRDAEILGPTLDPHAAFLILRGMKTYFLRYERECATALEVVAFLSRHERVARVHHPSLPDHPQHALAVKQMKDFGSVVTFDLQGDAENARRFADALRLFSMAASVGSTDSLIMPPQLLRAPDLTPAQRAATGYTPTTVRLSIGTEDAADLIADLAQALQQS
jgi:cystathionine beta-lyase/cystathionine gamma-synthase